MSSAGRIAPWRPSVRVRVLAAVLVLAASGMAVAGLTAYELQRRRTLATVTEALNRTVEEFSGLAADGVDPQTGEPFTTADRAIYVALQSMVPAPDEGMVGFVDGKLRWNAPMTVGLRLENDPELLAEVASLDPASPAGLHRLTTDRTRYAYVAVPVSGVGSTPSAADSGLFVVAVDVDAQMRALTATYRTYAMVAIGTLVLLATVAWAVTGRLLRPLRSLRETAHRVGRTDISERITVTGTDDISELATTVNAMLDRLEAAFVSQRRLLDDVGHELRTPLTVLRGHLELLDAGDADDVAVTRAITLDEVDRMNRLVDDLATLAGAERPDFARPVPTDLGLLTDDVFDKARALGAHSWSLTERADAIANVDAQRLTQAWLQLAANAVKFSPTGSTIRLGSDVHAGLLRLWVTDEGAGIAPADVDRVFERFERGSADRLTEGSGLGLPIVAAIAAAHGGRARVNSAPGAGCTVTLELPLRVPAESRTPSPEPVR